jgi:hypothetical protein
VTLPELLIDAYICIATRMSPLTAQRATFAVKASMSDQIDMQRATRLGTSGGQQARTDQRSPFCTQLMPCPDAQLGTIRNRKIAAFWRRFAAKERPW